MYELLWYYHLQIIDVFGMKTDYMGLLFAFVSFVFFSF